LKFGAGRLDKKTNFGCFHVFDELKKQSPLTLQPPSEIHLREKAKQASLK
jgi:hypothetical protein